MKNRQVAKAAAQVLELESAGELCFALTTLRTETRGQLQLNFAIICPNFHNMCLIMTIDSIILWHCI